MSRFYQHKQTFILLLVLIVACFDSTFAQFPFKLPQVPKSDKQTGDQSSKSTQTTAVSGAYLQRPVASSKAVLLKETIEIKPYSKESYWRFPNQGNYTSWVPQIDFRSFYDGSS